MPPHIFAMGQQAYRNMMVTRHDQSLILMGLSGSGKTFNTRYLLRYLSTIGQPENGPVTSEWAGQLCLSSMMKGAESRVLVLSSSFLPS